LVHGRARLLETVMDSGSGTTGGGPGRPPCWRTLEESCKGLGSVSLKNKQPTHTVFCSWLVKDVRARSVATTEVPNKAPSHSRTRSLHRVLCFVPCPRGRACLSAAPVRPDFGLCSMVFHEYVGLRKALRAVQQPEDARRSSGLGRGPGVVVVYQVSCVCSYVIDTGSTGSRGRTWGLP